MAMLDVTIHRSRFWKSEVARVDIDTPDVKRAVIVHYLASCDSIVIDLVKEGDILYKRLGRIDLNKVEVSVGNDGKIVEGYIERLEEQLEAMRLAVEDHRDDGCTKCRDTLAKFGTGGRARRARNGNGDSNGEE